MDFDFPGELSPSFTFSCTLQKPAPFPKRSGANEMKISEGLQQPWLEQKVVGTPLLALPASLGKTPSFQSLDHLGGVQIFLAVAMRRWSCTIFVMLAIRGSELKL